MVVEGQWDGPMKRSRRKLLRWAAGAVALPAVSRLARAQVYPVRPITMIVPFLAGSSLDATGRILAEGMTRSLGQQIIIENVGGADGSIGTGRAARAQPDGYTICLGAMATHVLNSAFYSLQYDVLSDFAPVTLLVTFPFVLFARKSLPARDLNELIAWLKANPTGASAGVGNIGARLLTTFFQKETRTQLTVVAYRGLPAAVQDLLAGRIDLLWSTPAMLALTPAGTIKTYAVTSPIRLTIALDVPTFAEMGLPTLSYAEWFSLFAPKGTPRDIIGKLNSAAVEALADPVVRARITDLGMKIFPRDRQTPEALRALQRADAEKWWPIIKEFGIKAEH
jgi:tripartite-type tricarboxylate transporter receptor subunit TctC